MFLLIIGLIAVASIGLSARYWLYKKIKAKFLIGQVIYNCPNPFIIYDFSKYNETGIVVVQVGTQDRKDDLSFGIYMGLRDKGYEAEDINRVMEEIGADDMLELFYVKDAIIPQNRINKTYGKWEGDLEVWDL